jgi:hypothetical protein
MAVHTAIVALESKETTEINAEDSESISEKSGGSWTTL